MSVQTIGVNVLTNDVYSSGIHVECIYIIDRFLLAMTLIHDLNNRTVSIQRIGIKHANFNTNLKMYQGARKLINESIYHGILSITDDHINLKGSFKRYMNSNVFITELTEEMDSKQIMDTDYEPVLQREITLKTSVSVTPDRESNAYLLTIQFIKAPSLLHDQSFVIQLDHHQILKDQFVGILAHKFDIYFANELISLIFDGYLTKYFWIYPPSSSTSLFESVTMDSYILHKIQRIYYYDRGLQGSKMNESARDITNEELVENMLLNYRISSNAIEKVECVLKTEPHDAVPCNINGIGIRIQINDPCINADEYPALFEMFAFYEIEPPNLSTIWSFDNPSKLYDLKHLYEGIEKYCDSRDAIEVNAQLLIDKNVDNKDIRLILVHWIEDRLRPSTNSIHFEWNFDLLHKFYTERAAPPSNVIDFNAYASRAQEMSHKNFDKSVELYVFLMKASSPQKRREIIENDKHHFGEALIALRKAEWGNYGIGLDNEMITVDREYAIWARLLRKKSDIGSLPDKYHKKQRFTRRHKWKPRNTDYNTKQQKKLSKNKLYRAKKYSYHRW